jgi:hypothetical protein
VKWNLRTCGGHINRRVETGLAGFDQEAFGGDVSPPIPLVIRRAAPPTPSLLEVPILIAFFDQGDMLRLHSAKRSWDGPAAGCDSSVKRQAFRVCFSISAKALDGR